MKDLITFNFTGLIDDHDVETIPLQYSGSVIYFKIKKQCHGKIKERKNVHEANVMLNLHEQDKGFICSHCRKAKSVSFI